MVDKGRQGMIITGVGDAVTVLGVMILQRKARQIEFVWHLNWFRAFPPEH
jgi:hypothetical protein